jgi:hypothetical protein
VRVSAHKDLVALAPLVALLAASQEIARLTEEYKSYHLVLRGAVVQHLYLRSRAAPAAVCPGTHEVPLGWARLVILEAARQVAEVIATPVEEIANLELGLGEEKLSDLVGDALDALWTG